MNRILRSAGLENVSSQSKAAIAMHLNDAMSDRVGADLFGRLDEAEVAEYQALIEQGSEEQLHRWLADMHPEAVDVTTAHLGQMVSIMMIACKSISEVFESRGVRV